MLVPPVLLLLRQVEMFSVKKALLMQHSIILQGELHGCGQGTAVLIQHKHNVLHDIDYNRLVIIAVIQWLNCRYFGNVSFFFVNTFPLECVDFRLVVLVNAVITTETVASCLLLCIDQSLHFISVCTAVLHQQGNCAQC